MVLGLVLIFIFTGAGVIYLSRDVNRRISNRSAAQAIAFQAARSGAQQISLASLRDGRPEAIVLDEERARIQATAVAVRLLVEFELDGTVMITDIQPRLLSVRVTVTDPAGDVVGSGSARPEIGP